MPPIFDAVSKGDLPRFKLELEQALKRNYPVNEQYLGYTVATFAAEKGRLAMLRHLVERAMPVGQHDFRGRTPLHDAAAGGHGSAVEFLLLQLGVDGQARNSLGENASHLAEHFRHPDVVALLARHGVTPVQGLHLTEWQIAGERGRSGQVVASERPRRELARGGPTH